MNAWPIASVVILGWSAASVLLPIFKVLGLVRFPWWLCLAPLALLAVLALLVVFLSGLFAAGIDDSEGFRSE